MSADFLRTLSAKRFAQGWAGVTSVCSAHPLVIEAALRQAMESGAPALIEATCNQVNHRGGYTGMAPADFRRLVDGIAHEVGFDPSRLILGGDHLGPNPWKHLAAEEAMREAAMMVDAYVGAGFKKIHLDTSMGCKGESPALPDELTAERAATLAAVSEAGAASKVVYVIGTEVPVPGGAVGASHTIDVTGPDAVKQTIEVHRQAFSRRNLQDAFSRAIAAVVQPGVEFGDDWIHVFDETKAHDLSGALDDLSGFAFEAHSTDYQPQHALDALVKSGFAILKVGPELTFALRETLYGLDMIATELTGDERSNLRQSIEEAMLADPRHWQPYYRGDERELYLKRHFSLSDRLRYYWPHPTVKAALERLDRKLGDRPLPMGLVSQHLGAIAPYVLEGKIQATSRALQMGAVQAVLARYGRACRK